MNLSTTQSIISLYQTNQNFISESEYPSETATEILNTISNRININNYTEYFEPIDYSTLHTLLSIHESAYKTLTGK